MAITQQELVNNVNSQLTNTVNGEIVWSQSNHPQGISTSILGSSSLPSMTTNNVTGSTGSVITGSTVINDLNNFASQFTKVRMVRYQEYTTLTDYNGNVQTTWGTDQTQVTSLSDSYRQSFYVSGANLGIVSGQTIKIPTISALLNEYHRLRNNTVSVQYCTHAQHSNHKNRGRR